MGLGGQARISWRKPVRTGGSRQGLAKVQGSPSKAQPDGAAGGPFTITMSRTRGLPPFSWPQPGHAVPWATAVPVLPGAQRAPWTPAMRPPGKLKARLQSCGLVPLSPLIVIWPAKPPGQ